MTYLRKIFSLFPLCGNISQTDVAFYAILSVLIVKQQSVFDDYLVLAVYPLSERYFILFSICISV